MATTEQKVEYGKDVWFTPRKSEPPIMCVKYEYGKKFSQHFSQYDFSAQPKEQVNSINVAHALLYINGKLEVILEGQWLEMPSTGNAPIKIWNENDLLNKYNQAK